jgi:hypothetical protein
VPLAISVAVVDSGVAGPHAPLEPPVTDPQVTMTALAGTVAHEPKVEGALTSRFQAPEPLPVVFHVTATAVDPVTDGVVSGLLAVNVMVAGVAAAFLMCIASGFGVEATGTGRSGGMCTGVPDAGAIRIASRGITNIASEAAVSNYVALIVNNAVAV